VKRHAKASSVGSNSGSGSSLGSPRFRFLVVLCLALALLGALTASPALAVQTHPYTGTSFGPDGTSGSSFSRIASVAVDPANGNVYAYDSSAGKIYKFDSVGNPVNFSGLAGNAIEGLSGYGPGESQLAIAPPGSPGGTAGDIYVAIGTALLIYGPDGKKLGQLGGEFPCGVATSPSGQVFVGNYPETIVEYTPTANPATDIDQTGISNAALPEVCNVAADGLGNVYGTNYYGGYPAFKLEALEAENRIALESDPPYGSTIATDPASDDVYSNRGSSIAQYDPSGALVNVFGADRLFESYGVAINATSGKIYAGNGKSQQVDVFGPLATVAGVTPNPATAITASKATLNGTVNPGAITVSDCKFEYGTSTEYGETAPCEGAIPTDSSDHPITAALSGLQANTTYHFRIAATNANGTNRSSDQTFTTANFAVTGEADSVTGAKATLNGVVFPEGEAIDKCFFEYGINGAFDQTVPCAGATPPDEGEHAVSAALSHLTPNGSVYSFRLVIERAGETTQGKAQSFATKETVITTAATASAIESATLHGTINPEGTPITECKFKYATEADFEPFTSIPCAESGAEIGTGESPVTVHADLSGLTPPGATYHYRLVAATAFGLAEGKARRLGEPLLKAQQASGVTETATELVATINPNGLATTYHLEYGTTAAYGQSTPEEAVGADETDHALVSVLEGLAPDTTYHWHAVTTNPHGKIEGVDRTFTTFATFSPETGCANQALRSGASAGLPNCRAYEMVSPAQKAGEVFPPDSTGTLGGSCVDCLPVALPMPEQSSPDGEAFIYSGQPFSGGLASGANEYLSRRTPGGWATQSLSSPLTGPRYRAFSSDFSRGVIFQLEPALSAEAPSKEGKSYANLYLREPDGSMRPLITTAPPHRTSGEPVGSGSTVFRAIYAGANSGTGSSPAFHHLVFQANDTLTGPTTTAPAPNDLGVVEDKGEPVALNLYEWFEGQLRLVNVLPGNASPSAGAVIGSGTLLDPSGLQGRPPNVDHAISADGSRIFWSEESSGQVYVRIDGEETRKIEDPGKFLTATPDGSKVLLNDGCLYDLAAEECEADLAQGQGGKFKGILGAADDLSRVYFVDTAVLTGGEENANHEHAEADKFNLYTWHKGATVFIGTLLESDNNLGSEYGDWKASRPTRTAQVSSDGNFLAFMSKVPLTGYDNVVSGGGECQLNGGPLCIEVFEYAAASGSLTCVSCNPSGRQPLGRSNLSVNRPGSGFPPFPQLGNLSTEGQGRIFFESQDTLSPRDLNGNIQDVYQWEPNGVGNCKRASGCVSLISSGHSANDSMFVDSTPSGNDAFFITREQLLLRDKDDFLDLYDARVGGGISENTPPPCLGEACKGPSSAAPEQQSAGSASFVGPGNEKPKKAKKHKKKHRKHAHKHKSHKRAAKHNSGGSK
jgi:hypothetical protein